MAQRASTDGSRRPSAVAGGVGAGYTYDGGEWAPGAGGERKSTGKGKRPKTGSLNGHLVGAGGDRKRKVRTTTCGLMERMGDPTYPNRSRIPWRINP